MPEGVSVTPTWVGANYMGKHIDYGNVLSKNRLVMHMKTDEQAVLASTAKRFGFTWEKLHSYKKMMQLPITPDAMPTNPILEESYSGMVVNGGGGADSFDGVGSNSGQGSGRSASVGSTNLCEMPYNHLDRCMITQIGFYRPEMPFKRMYVCRIPFQRFTRCVQKRDHNIMQKVFKWERPFYLSLGEEAQKEYIDDLTKKLDYIEYLVRNESTVSDKIAAERDFVHLKLRYENLVSGAPNAELLKFWRRIQFAPVSTSMSL